MGARRSLLHEKWHKSFRTVQRVRLSISKSNTCWQDSRTSTLCRASIIGNSTRDIPSLQYTCAQGSQMLGSPAPDTVRHAFRSVLLPGRDLCCANLPCSYRASACPWDPAGPRLVLRNQPFPAFLRFRVMQDARPAWLGAGVLPDREAL